MSEPTEAVPWHSTTPVPPLARRTKGTKSAPKSADEVHLPDPDWERKQRAQEYRVAARTERRRKKADEKKQRKLDASILRRMTWNIKYAERDRLRAIRAERRTTRHQAIKQAERLAAIHDPTGASFNIGPVIREQDGTIISLKALRRREKRNAIREQRNIGPAIAQESFAVPGVFADPTRTDAATSRPSAQPAAVDPSTTQMSETLLKPESKTPRNPPPKPIIPSQVILPADEENWLDLWDFSDEGIERRVLQAKKWKASEREQLQLWQQAGKEHWPAARDEKRRVYRDLKLTWKTLRATRTSDERMLRSAEEEEERKIALEISTRGRQQALELCKAFGYTMENTRGLDNIQPRAVGLKGTSIDLEKALSGNAATHNTSNVKRVDLSAARGANETYIAPTENRTTAAPEDFLSMDVGAGQDYKATSYNHTTNMRGKVRRAVRAAEMQKEEKVRDRMRKHCQEEGFSVPIELNTPIAPVYARGQRILEDGTLESTKAEGVRKRLELAAVNAAATVLRKQAQQLAIEAGIRVYAELTGQIPKADADEKSQPKNYGPGWLVVEESG